MSVIRSNLEFANNTLHGFSYTRISRSECQVLYEWQSVFMTLQLSLHLLGLLLYTIKVSKSSIFYVFIVIETLRPYKYREEWNNLNLLRETYHLLVNHKSLNSILICYILVFLKTIWGPSPFYPEKTGLRKNTRTVDTLQLCGETSEL